MRTLAFEDFGSSLIAKEKIRVWKDRSYGLDLIEDLGSALVRDAQYEGSGHVAGSLFLAESKDGGAGGVRDGVGVAEISVAIFKGMEGKEVKRAVGDEDQVFRLEVTAERGDKLCVERFQVTLRGL